MVSMTILELGEAARTRERKGEQAVYADVVDLGDLPVRADLRVHSRRCRRDEKVGTEVPHLLFDILRRGDPNLKIGAVLVDGCGQRLPVHERRIGDQDAHYGWAPSPTDEPLTGYADRLQDSGLRAVYPLRWATSVPHGTAIQSVQTFWPESTM